MSYNVEGLLTPLTELCGSWQHWHPWESYVDPWQHWQSYVDPDSTDRDVWILTALTELCGSCQHDRVVWILTALTELCGSWQHWQSCVHPWQHWHSCMDPASTDRVVCIPTSTDIVVWIDFWVRLKGILHPFWPLYVQVENALNTNLGKNPAIYLCNKMLTLR